MCFSALYYINTINQDIIMTTPITDKCITTFFAVLFSPLLLIEYIKQRRELAKFKAQVHRERKMA